ncbi:monosaccharide ABC transporter ATP-binding protein, CUT2 family [Variovorax sp. OV329]|nr:monosaccharide ABC transporter ATP-binding protein, CUT2 family [Variovorax sp. OV329]
MHGIAKAFAGHPALRGADLRVGPGEVHALIGQNGAGKSTLIKILTGAYAKDAGSIRFAGEEVSFRSPGEAQAAGIATIYQELNLVPTLSLAENVFLGREPRRFGLIDWKRIETESRRILRDLGIEVDVTRALGSVNTATQQMAAIARAVSARARLVIMDEPTSSLDEREVEILFGVIRRLKADGIAVILVSHRLDELYAVCERITVLRDGQTVAAREMAGFGKLELVACMLGKDITTGAAAAGGKRKEGADLLALQHAASGSRVQDASLTIRRGETLGLAGLLGSGRTELARTLFGADALDRGDMHFKGQRVRFGEPAQALRAGIAYLSEDRRAEGIVPELSIRENITLAVLPGLARLGVIDRRRESEIARDFIRSLGIRCAGPEQRISELSGGNQQKVLLARWLAARIDLLLLDEPTRGIDIGARAEILSLIRKLCETEGMAVLMIASELEELVDNSDRIVVLRDGRTVAELSGPAMTQAHVMQAMAHGDAPALSVSMP